MDTVVNRGVHVHAGLNSERVLLVKNHLGRGHVALFLNGLSQLEGPVNGYGATEQEALRDLAETMDGLPDAHAAQWAAGVRAALGEMNRPVTQMSPRGQEAILSIRRRNGTLPVAAPDAGQTAVGRVTAFLKSLVA